MIRRNREDRELEEWNKMKSKGKNKYILVNGVLKWGVVMAVTATIVVQAIGKGFSLNNFSYQSFFIKLILFLVVFSIDGYIYSILSWKKYKKKYGDN